MKSQHQSYIDILNLYGCQERQLKKIVASTNLALSIVPEPSIMLVLSQPSGYLQRCIGVGCLGFSWKRLHPILTSGFAWKLFIHIFHPRRLSGLLKIQVCRSRCPLPVTCRSCSLVDLGHDFSDIFSIFSKLFTPHLALDMTRLPKVANIFQAAFSDKFLFGHLFLVPGRHP